MSDANTSTAEFPAVLITEMHQRHGLHVSHFNEDRGDLIVLGHADLDAALAAMDAEERHVAGSGLIDDPDFPVSVSDLQHRWGVLGNSSPGDLWMDYGSELGADDPGAFPITVLIR